MRFLIVLVGLFIFSVSCNRTANQVVANQEKPAEVAKSRPQPMEADIKSAYAEAQVIEEEVIPESSPISKQLRPDPTPAFVINPETGEKEPTIVVEFKESGCIQDTCQQFTIQLLADYTFRYVGIANVDLLGEFTGKADFNPLLKIGPLTSKVGFFRMDEVYPKGAEVDGILTAITSIYVDHRGRQNLVVDVSDAPAGFNELEKEVLSWVERVIWVPVEE